MTRTTVNERIGRIKMMFRWAAEMMIVRAAVFHMLATVAGLRRGRSAEMVHFDGKPMLYVARAAVYECALVTAGAVPGARLFL